MRVLVTGSHGFIGRNLVKALRERGDEVWEGDIKHPFCWDVTQHSLPHRMDVIYHLACINQEQAAFNPEWNVEVNALGTRRMAHIAAETGAKLIYTSTASVYGQASEIPTPVTAELRPKTDYAVAKLAGEHFVRNSKAKFMIARLSNVYGPHQTTDNPYCGVVAKFIDAAKRGEPLKIYGDGLQTRDFTYVDDVVQHLLWLGDSEWYGHTYNLSYGKETSILELARLIMLAFPGSTCEFAPERSVDGISRRLLKSMLIFETGLVEGLQKTLQWTNEQEEVVSVGPSDYLRPEDYKSD